MGRLWVVLGLVALVATGCGGETADDGDSASLEFPWDGEASGKTDVFGRSLVGMPNPYVADAALLADPAAADAELGSNMERRREVAWQTIFKALEPVPLVGLANQLEALPDCPDAVTPKQVDGCLRQASADDCTGYTAADTAICGWDAEANTCAPTCDKLTADGVVIPNIPRWQTWYGVEDITQIFKHGYGALSDEEQRARTPLSDQVIGEAFVANHTAVERSSRWPLWRYTSKVGDLFDCNLTQGADETDEDFGQRCAESLGSQFSGSAAPGAGIARLMYSPAMVLHMMRNYGEVLDCRDDTLADTWCGDGTPCVDPPDNFSTCFASEFPADAGDPWAALDPDTAGDVAGLPAPGGTVVIKATWARVGFGFELPAFDTDAEALTARIGAGNDALWPEDGDRVYAAPVDPNSPEFPTFDDIYTIRTKSGAVYRLTALHIMTKELRHWQWITLWWSDKPDTDFGEDRPDYFSNLPGVWSNYKMCVVTDYIEHDAELDGRFGGYPSLQAALLATESLDGTPSWCSNPYIEHGAGNARTNCIGCHQHAGTRIMPDETDFDLEAVIATEASTGTPFPANGRTRVRTHFATDYSWAFSRLDDLTELIRKEVEFKGTQDSRWVRINTILNAQETTVAAGEMVFRSATMDETCTDCHGDAGEGGLGPNLEQVFASKTDWELLHTIINGRGDMPAWGERLTDVELANLFTYLKATHDAD